MGISVALCPQQELELLLLAMKIAKGPKGKTSHIQFCLSSVLPYNSLPPSLLSASFLCCVENGDGDSCAGWAVLGPVCSVLPVFQDAAAPVPLGGVEVPLASTLPAEGGGPRRPAPALCETIFLKLQPPLTSWDYGLGP